MSGIRFEWDKRKNTANRRKHGVTFEEAETVFLDEQALLMGDPEHSTGEDRYLLLGASSRPRLLVVCHTYRHKDEVIRIISARTANRRERNQYRDRWEP